MSRSRPSGGVDYPGLLRLYRTFGSYYARHWKPLAGAMVGLLLTIGVALLMPWPLKMIIDNVLLGRPLPERLAFLSRWSHGDVNTLLALLVIGFVALRIADSVVSYVHKVGLLSVGQTIATEIRERLFGRMQRLSMSFHDSARRGDLLLRMITDVHDLKAVLIEVPENFVYRLAMIASHVGFMLVLDWRLALVGFSVVPVLYVFNRRIGKGVNAAASHKRTKEGDVASLVAENVTAMALIQAYGREDLQQARFAAENRESLASGIRAMKLSKAFKRTSDILVALGTCGVVYLGGRRALDGSISPGTLVLFAAYLRNLYLPIDKFAGMLLDIATAQVSANRVIELIESDATVSDPPGAVAAPRFRGRVEFQAVDFAYRPDRPVLRSLSFVVEPGETVALIGHNGAGKSTVLSLLLRFYQPQRGRILIDGKDVATLTLRSVREQITVLMQDAPLFNKTVRDNIAFGKIGATAEEVVRAARLAQAHDFIERIPGGYGAMIHERGRNLSGGERQRLNIARAIVRDAPIVMLDEPVSSLDARAEADVHDALAELTHGKTTFLVAHKLSTVAGAHKILMLEQGTIAAFGTHDELLATSPEYRTLWELQSADESLAAEGRRA